MEAAVVKRVAARVRRKVIFMGISLVFWRKTGCNESNLLFSFYGRSNLVEKAQKSITSNLHRVCHK